ncbi:MAG: YraN family protein [Anaerotignum sp.]|nr:YraN family protein [Anaerotignum sp.]MCI8866916.1 YraN family protein [Anaerotignum sp.]
MERMGYEILERNYRRRDGEIDIIAQKDGYTVFTEVKYRKNSRNGFPSEAVDWRKQQSIIRTAKAYVAEKGLEGGEYRFDVAEILTGDGKTYFRYTEDAFRLP